VKYIKIVKKVKNMKPQQNKQKKLYYYTLSEEIEREFVSFIEDNFIDKSKLIEGLISKYLEEKKNKN